MADLKRNKKKDAGKVCGGQGGRSGVPTEPLRFSDEAKAVFESGRQLWTYDHSMPDGSRRLLYDIREYFQERNGSGRLTRGLRGTKVMKRLCAYCGRS